MLSVNISDIDQKWCVHLQGEVDIYTVDKFKSALEEKMEIEQRDLIIDMSNLEYIDSTGLGALINIRGKYNGLNIELKNLRSNVRRLFEITGLTKIFVVI